MIRFFDIFFSLIAIIILSPLYIFISFLIILFYSKPVFFVQPRVTLNEKLFDFLKFRSMKIFKNVNQGDKKDYLTLELEELKKIRNQYKTTSLNDSRVTKLGSFLRKTSLDEIPQFFSVLKGDMSLVGPRPDPPIQRADYDYEVWKKRCSVKSGITGLAQISSRNTSNLKTRVDFDMYWVDNKSILLYFKILLKTPFSLLSKY